MNSAMLNRFWKSFVKATEECQGEALSGVEGPANNNPEQQSAHPVVVVDIQEGQNETTTVAQVSTLDTTIKEEDTKIEVEKEAKPDEEPAIDATADGNQEEVRQETASTATAPENNSNVDKAAGENKREDAGAVCVSNVAHTVKMFGGNEKNVDDPKAVDGNKNAGAGEETAPPEEEGASPEQVPSEAEVGVSVNLSEEEGDDDDVATDPNWQHDDDRLMWVTPSVLRGPPPNLGLLDAASGGGNNPVRPSRPASAPASAPGSPPPENISPSALIKEQDIAYIRALEQAKEVEEERKRAKEEEERKKEERAARIKEATEKLKPEPPTSTSKDVITIRFHTAKGTVERRFNRKQSVHEVFLYLASREFLSDEYDVAFSPSMLLKDTDVETFEDWKMNGRFVLYVYKKKVKPGIPMSEKVPGPPPQTDPKPKESPAN